MEIDTEKAFIEAVIASKKPTTIFLTNGVKLQGKIAQHDSKTLTLSRDGVTQLAYKHAISTIMPPEDDVINAGNKI